MPRPQKGDAKRRREENNEVKIEADRRHLLTLVKLLENHLKDKEEK
jgi:hypothetical protein